LTLPSRMQYLGERKPRGERQGKRLKQGEKRGTWTSSTEKRKEAEGGYSIGDSTDALKVRFTSPGRSKVEERRFTGRGKKGADLPECSSRKERKKWQKKVNRSQLKETTYVESNEKRIGRGGRGRTA